MLSHTFYFTCLVAILCGMAAIAVSQSPGFLLGITALENGTIAVIRIDDITGDVETVTTDFPQEHTGYIYYGADTPDLKKGIYYVALLSGESGSLLLGFDAYSGKTFTKAVIPNLLFFLLAYHPGENTLYGVALNPKTKIATLYRMNWEFDLKPIGTFPMGIPLDNAGTFDPVHGVIYYFYATLEGTPKFASMNVKTGHIVNDVRPEKTISFLFEFESVPYCNTVGISSSVFSLPASKLADSIQVAISRKSIYFTIFYDSIQQRLVGVAQNFTGTHDYYLAIIDENGEGHPIGNSVISPRGFYPTVSAISSEQRNYYVLMTSETQIDFTTVSLDTGAVVRRISNWSYLPIDLCWFPKRK